MDITSLRSAWKFLQARLGIRHVNLFSNSDFIKKYQQITQHQRPWSFICIAFQGDKNDQSFPSLNPPITLNPKFAKFHRTSLGLHAFSAAAVAERHRSVVLHASSDMKPPAWANLHLMRCFSEQSQQTKLPTCGKEDTRKGTEQIPLL